MTRVGRGYVTGQTKTAHRVRRINELKSSGYVQKEDRRVKLKGGLG